MDDKSKETGTMLVIIFVVLLISLLAIGISVFQIMQRTGGLFANEKREKIPFVFEKRPSGSGLGQEVVVKTDNPDYAFQIGEEGVYYLDNTDLSYYFETKEEQIENPDDLESGIIDQSFVEEVVERGSEFNEVEFGDLSRIEIPVIGVTSPILQGANGDELLDQGWWLYPASYVNEPGEKIFYCHRRFFGRLDPRTCWNLNKVVDGDEVIITNTSGKKFTYKVISTSIVHEEVTSVMRPSDRDYVKIITCGTETGAPGGNEYRFVVLAQLQVDSSL